MGMTVIDMVAMDTLGVTMVCSSLGISASDGTQLDTLGFTMVKVLEFFDCPGPRQGVEDLRELLHKGAQGNHEAEVFQVSNDDTAVAQRRLEDKQLKEKTSTDCLVKEQENEYQTGWKIKTGNVLDSCNQRSTQQCMKSVVAKHLGSGMSNIFWAEDTTRSTYLVNRSPLSAIGFKKPIDMLGFFGWLASIEQGMLEPIKVKCIFLGYHKSMVGNKLWRLDDVTSKVVIYRNMGFNESGEYKKTFISSGVGTGSMHVLHGFEFEVEPLGDHTFEVEPQENVDQRVGLQEVQTQDLMDYQLARHRDQHLACELFGYREDSNEVAFAISVVEKIYAHKKSSDDSHDYYWEYAPVKGNILGLKIIRDQGSEWGSTLSLEDSLSGDCDVEKNGHGLMIRGCTGSLRARVDDTGMCMTALKR
ncbi:hypothetical protein Tco_0842364 [Tanacetum coccineum]|uniref:Zinc finger, CCHC-type n=1 Tax=Tanacetum coccineum TaxID=301880 RepID=A0ABQ5B2K1_9ASTR